MVRRVAFSAGVLLLLCAAAFGIGGTWPWTRLSDEVPTLRPLVVSNAYRVVQDTLQQGESVATLLRREGITGLNLTSLAAAMRFDPRKIKAGLVFSVRRDHADSATHVEFRPTADQRLRFIRTSSGWTGETVPVRWNADTVRIVADIHSNLYEALDRRVSDATFNHDERVRLAGQLADVNEYTVDFSRDLQPGDHFAAVVERQISEDGEVRFSRVLANQFVVGHKTFEAFSFPSRDGDAFYDADGQALKRAFLVSPVDFRYISSGFSSARFHPILHLMRKHEGVDFVAPFGTPVRAAGDGVVTVAGRSGGYGNLVEIQHRNGITTRYGHLSHIGTGLRPGTHVDQGEVIGLVGMTGLATAPHLHYEFRVDNQARDPASIKSEPGTPLPAGDVPEFQRRRQLLLQLLGGADATTPLTE